MYDVLRDNIGLLQPINEGILNMFKKKPTRLQRFKNFVGRNKVRIGTGALTLAGAGWLGRSRYNYNKALTNARKTLADRKEDWNEDTKNRRFWKYKDGTKKSVIMSPDYGWNPLKGYGDQKLGLNFYNIEN